MALHGMITLSNSLQMILIFAHKCRAYLAVGIRNNEFPEQVQITVIGRVPISNRKRFLDEVLHALKAERPGPNAMVRLQDDPAALICNKYSGPIPMNLITRGFVIFRAESGGYTFRNLERKDSGEWTDESDGPIESRELVSGAALKRFASHIADIIHELVGRQKRNGEARRTHFYL